MGKSTKSVKRIKDKSQRATFDTVLDPKTLAILSKLVKRQALCNLTGCLSAGKEANVYTGFLNLQDVSCKFINNYKKFNNHTNVSIKDGNNCDVCESINAICMESGDEHTDVKYNNGICSDDYKNEIQIKNEDNFKSEFNTELKYASIFHGFNDNIKTKLECNNLDSNNNKLESDCNNLDDSLESDSDNLDDILEDILVSDSNNLNSDSINLDDSLELDSNNFKSANINIDNKGLEFDDCNSGSDINKLYSSTNNSKKIFDSIQEYDYDAINHLYLHSDIFNSHKYIPCAIKIYQTSIMQFKDRLKYIKSEKRYTTFCNTNPRKLIKIWAEKEVRNLKRLNKHHIPSPVPLYLKKNILIMSLITNSTNTPAIKLKDFKCDYNLDFNVDDCYQTFQLFYIQVITIMHEMYTKCNLIHSDLSEYNLLCVDMKIFVIDLGQAVEKGHENADEFLIKDILNINRFFDKKGCQVRNVNELFVSITGKVIPVCLRDIDIMPGICIPMSIEEVNCLDDVQSFLKKGKSILYERKEKIQPSFVSKDDRKVNKKIVKEEQREKRLNKKPKSEKKKFKKLKMKRR